LRHFQRSCDTTLPANVIDLTHRRKVLVADLLTIGKRIARAREHKGLTQPQLAAAVIGNPDRFATISKWENDHSVPGGTEIAAIAQALEVSTDWLLLGKGPDRSAEPTPEHVREELARYNKARGNGGGIDWVPRLIEKVIDGEGEERTKLAMVEAIIAGGRNHTAYGEAMAAVQRGVALEGESVAANGRNEVALVESQKAADRANGKPAHPVEHDFEADALARQRGEGGESRTG
jgi:transcriptional regulator with XRE-family HTH domain